MTDRPSTWRTLLGKIPQSEPPMSPNVVPMRKRSWQELEREVVVASAEFSRLIDEGDRIKRAYHAEEERLADEARVAAERVMLARKLFAEKCAEIGARVEFADEIVDEAETETPGE